METQAVGAESISLDVVKRVFAAFDVDLAETRNERTNELLASMMAGLLSGEGSIPADLVRRALAAYEVDLAVKKPFFSEKTGRRFTWTLLQKASTWDGDVSMVKALLAVGCELDSDLLHFAAGNGHVDVVHVLLEAGADAMHVNGFGWTALNFAIFSGELAAVQVLLDAGIDINARDGEGRTPLENALYYGQRTCLEPLLRAGATFDDESLAGIEREGPLPVGPNWNSRDRDSAWRYMDRVQAAGGYDQLVRTYRRVLTAPRSCLVKYLEFRFGRPAPADLVPSVLEFWKPPGGG